MIAATSQGLLVLNFVGWKQRKEVARDLKTIYTAAIEAEAEVRLDEFAAKWDAKSRTHTTYGQGILNPVLAQGDERFEPEAKKS